MGQPGLCLRIRWAAAAVAAAVAADGDSRRIRRFVCGGRGAPHVPRRKLGSRRVGLCSLVGRRVWRVGGQRLPSRGALSFADLPAESPPPALALLPRFPLPPPPRTSRHISTCPPPTRRPHSSQVGALGGQTFCLDTHPTSYKCGVDHLVLPPPLPPLAPLPTLAAAGNAAIDPSVRPAAPPPVPSSPPFAPAAVVPVLVAVEKYEVRDPSRNLDLRGGTRSVVNGVEPDAIIAACPAWYDVATCTAAANRTVPPAALALVGLLADPHSTSVYDRRHLPILLPGRPEHQGPAVVALRLASGLHVGKQHVVLHRHGRTLAAERGPRQPRDLRADHSGVRRIMHPQLGRRGGAHVPRRALRQHDRRAEGGRARLGRVRRDGSDRQLFPGPGRLLQWRLLLD